MAEFRRGDRVSGVVYQRGPHGDVIRVVRYGRLERMSESLNFYRVRWDTGEVRDHRRTELSLAPHPAR